jgi:hypothetical protein
MAVMRSWLRDAESGDAKKLGRVDRVRLSAYRRNPRGVLYGGSRGLYMTLPRLFNLFY